MLISLISTFPKHDVYGKRQTANSRQLGCSGRCHLSVIKTNAASGKCFLEQQLQASINV